MFSVKSVHMPDEPIALDPELHAILQESGRSSSDTIRDLVVMGLYRGGRSSQGKAADMLHLTRLDFIRRAADAGIPYFRMSVEEGRLGPARKARPRYAVCCLAPL